MGFALGRRSRQAPRYSRYHGGEGNRRYYQDAAIRAVFEKIARCERKGRPKRALLSLATGAGKTFIAVNLLKRIADAGQLAALCSSATATNCAPKALAPSRTSSAPTPPRSSEQATRRRTPAFSWPRTRPSASTDEADANFLTDQLPRELLHPHHHRRVPPLGLGQVVAGPHPQPDAVQIGLTATPRQLRVPGRRAEDAKADPQITADNLDYFGEPVYEYDIGQGIEDGYLAACEIIKQAVFLDVSTSPRSHRHRSRRPGRQVAARRPHRRARRPEPRSASHYERRELRGAAPHARRVAGHVRRPVRST